VTAVPDTGALSDLVTQYEGALGWASAASVAMLVGSLVLLAAFVARMPSDYFASPEPRPSPWSNRHPALHALMRVIRNAAGLVLLVSGVAMLVLPGQGLLTILMAVILLEFPGKRRLELRLVRQPQIMTGLNWVRERLGREPFQVFEG